MRRRKPRFVLPFFALFAIWSLFSCSSITKDRLVGKWQLLDDNGEILTKPVTKVNTGTFKITIYRGTAEFKGDDTYVMVTKANDGTFTNSGAFRVLSGSTISMSSVEASSTFSGTQIPKGEVRENIYDISISGDILTMKVQGGEFSNVYKRMN